MTAVIQRCIPLVLALLLGGAGCSMLGFGREAATPPPEPDVLERDTYVIGQGDRLRVTVWKNGELSIDSVPVRPDGKISVPLLDDVQAAGLKPEELKELLTQSLGEYVANPDVTVVVLEVNSKRIHILGGGVSQSNAIPLTQDMRVLDAIAIAGGFTQFAKKNDIRVLRREGGGIVEYRFDYDAYLKGQGLESNLLLHPGDTIVVPD